MLIHRVCDPVEWAQYTRNRVWAFRFLSELLKLKDAEGKGPLERFGITTETALSAGTTGHFDGSGGRNRAQ